MNNSFTSERAHKPKFRLFGDPLRIFSFTSFPFLPAPFLSSRSCTLYTSLYWPILSPILPKSLTMFFRLTPWELVNIQRNTRIERSIPLCSLLNETIRRRAKWWRHKWYDVYSFKCRHVQKSRLRHRKLRLRWEDIDKILSKSTT